MNTQVQAKEAAVPKPVVAGAKKYPFYFGGTAACAAAVLTHPLDLFKVRLQTQKGKGASAGSILSGIFKSEGIPGFYRGLSASLLRQASYSTVRFGAYDEIKHRLTDNGMTGPGYSLLSGVVAGAMGGVAGNPADVANVRMQNDGSLPAAQRRNYKNVFNALTRMAKEDGVRAWFSGLGPNIGRAMLMTSSQIGTYDIFKEFLISTGVFVDNPVTHFTSSIMAGLVATTVTSPFDVIKTRMMGGAAGQAYSGLFNAMGSIAKTEGVAALFKGWTPAFLRLGPHTVCTFLVLEQLKAAYFRSKQ